VQARRRKNLESYAYDAQRNREIDQFRHGLVHVRLEEAKRIVPHLGGSDAPRTMRTCDSDSIPCAAVLPTGCSSAEIDHNIDSAKLWILAPRAGFEPATLRLTD
jgi:hypothetical protein